MNTTNSLPGLMLSIPSFNELSCVLLLMTFAFYAFFRESQLDLVNGSKLLEFGNYESRKRFSEDAAGVMRAGLRKANIFRLVANREKVVLAPKFVHEIRNHPDLAGPPAFIKENKGRLSGFEVFGEINNEGVFQDLVRIKITRNLAKLTKPLCAESSVLLKEEWTDSRDWHAIPIHETFTHFIARLSALVFVGDELYRNMEWHKATIGYTEASLPAAEQLNMWPEFLWPIVARFSPSCRNLRALIARARAVLSPVPQKRAAAKEAGVQKEHQDALQWVDEVANGREYDPVLTQILLSIAAIHTSSDLLSQAVFDICSYEDRDTLLQELRTEIISTIRGGGWEKSSLQNLKLMDSVLKESQRLKPPALTTMDRHAGKKVELSDGSIIPKGAFTMIPNFRMWDSNLYPNPTAFDPYRFLRLREAGNPAAHLVSTSPEHTAFGHGKHACPGRFFAANEVKILLSHVLLKYDVKLLDNCTPAVMKLGVILMADPTAKIAIRRRQEEISLDAYDRIVK